MRKYILFISACFLVLFGCGPQTSLSQGNAYTSTVGNQSGSRRALNEDDEDETGKKPHQQARQSVKPNNGSGHKKNELATIKDLVNYIKPKTLYVFDIDETLMYEQGHSKHQGAPKQAELPHTLSIFNQVKAQTTNHNQAQESKIMFLTARCSNQPARANLAGIGISAHTAWLQGVGLSHKNNRGFHDEVFYACHTSKGAMLKSLLQQISGSYDFDHVVFIDDNQNYVNDVHDHLKTHAKPKSISLHYTGAKP